MLPLLTGSTVGSTASWNALLSFNIVGPYVVSNAVNASTRSEKSARGFRCSCFKAWRSAVMPVTAKLPEDCAVGRGSPHWVICSAS